MITKAIKLMQPQGLPAVYKNSGKAVFFKPQKTTSQVENEILKLRFQISDHRKNYINLKQKLNQSFGDDWIFCYDDLNDKQSDMYIQCISEMDFIALCRQKLEKLTQTLFQNMPKN